MESEEPVQQHLSELFERTHPDCVLDVGANEGQYGELLRAHGFEGWIVSFEPVGSAFAELAQRTESDPHWRAIKLALGPQTERRAIAVASVTQLSSFRAFGAYARTELPGASVVVEQEEVEIRRLDECWQELLEGIPTRRLFLKLDTQGWDLEVLAGASGLLDRLVGLQLEAALTSIYEHAPMLTETIEHVSGLGFGLTGVFPVNRDSMFRLIEVDCVFINPSHADAERWREDTWAILTQRFREDVTAGVPPETSFVLIDDDALGLEELEGRRAIPFIERDGRYYGPPEDGAQAVSELERQVSAGVRHLALAWPSFWWLEEYPELAQRLHSGWSRVRETNAVIVFEQETTAAGRQAQPPN